MTGINFPRCKQSDFGDYRSLYIVRLTFLRRAHCTWNTELYESVSGPQHTEYESFMKACWAHCTWNTELYESVSGAHGIQSFMKACWVHTEYDSFMKACWVHLSVLVPLHMESSLRHTSIITSTLKVSLNYTTKFRMEVLGWCGYHSLEGLAKK